MSPVEGTWAEATRAELKTKMNTEIETRGVSGISILLFDQSGKGEQRLDSAYRTFYVYSRPQL